MFFSHLGIFALKGLSSINILNELDEIFIIVISSHILVWSGITFYLCLVIVGLVSRSLVV